MNINWNKIKTEYITTDISYDEIAKKYEISETTVKQRGLREKWVEGRSQYKAEITAKIVDKAGETEAEAIRVMKEKERKRFDVLYGLIDKTIEQIEIFTPEDLNRIANAELKLQTMMYKNYGIADKHEVGGFGNKPISVDLSGLTKEELEMVKECQQMLKSI